MIYVTHALPVNGGEQPGQPGHPVLSREQVWDGLVLKANNALPFVPAMTRCEVVERHGEDVFDREIVLRGQPHTERITLLAPRRVVFTRIRGPVLGTIVNEIEGPEDALALRFSYALVVTDVEPGSAAEAEYAEGMSADYLQAVEATLGAVRRLAAESPQDAATRV